MPPYASEFLSSEIFEVIAESGQKTFPVHSNILAAQSETLASAVKHALGAPTERKINLEDWDGDTVGRFIDFLYLGNYQVPKPEPLPQEEGSEANASEAAISEASFSQNGAYTPSMTGSEGTVLGDESVAAQNRPLTPLWQLRDFDDDDCEYGDDGEGDGYNPLRGPGDTEHLHYVLYHPSQHDYKAALLAHAKVYALAKCQGIEALQKIAIRRLQTALMSVRSVDHGPHLAENIVELLRYAYTSTNSRASPEKRMRKIAIQFAALNFPDMQSEKKMRDLMEEGGDIVGDLMDRVCRRLVNSESELATSEEALQNYKTITSYELQIERQQKSVLQVQISGTTYELQMERQENSALEEEILRLSNAILEGKGVTNYSLEWWIQGIWAIAMSGLSAFLWIYITIICVAVIAAFLISLVTKGRYYFSL